MSCDSRLPALLHSTGWTSFALKILLEFILKGEINEMKWETKFSSDKIKIK